MSDALPSDLRAANPLDANRWSAWVKAQDLAIRQRLDRGTEDTLTNLLRFGVTFTKEYRIDDEYLIRYGQSSLVNAFADNRAKDLVAALADPNAPEGIAEMRRFVEHEGFSLKTPQERAKLTDYLLGNLARLRDEFLKYRAQTKDEKRFQLFQDRGISLDTNLWPDYALDLQFRNMVEKRLLKPGSVRRIAIVGPGLDFANKEAGNDFYPPQTIQPFAVLDSLFRLGIAEPATVQLYTLDISQEVNAHIQRAQQKATQGRSYTVQLPWNTERPMSDEYRANFTAYWHALGEKIGEPVAPIPVPSAAAGTKTRALKVRPEIVQKVTALDMNVVYQRLDLSSEQAFDLVIGTNIFVYYREFEQLLARANVAAMLKPGGYLLSNDKLADKVTLGLDDVLETPITSSVQPLVQDTMFCYQRSK
ncbi:MAG TPA: class I SAM-dependent methyltransferase [Terriglobales bacterium]|nr:class I SAM-dependent methyltransferase [Terriglobales bacterium]